MKVKELTPATKFKTEWSSTDFTNAKNTIFWYIVGNKSLKFSTGEPVKAPRMFNYTDVENFLGLAYTSSSDCAGLWLCNVDAWVNDTHHIIGFAISAGNKVVAVCWDKDENELLIEI